MNSPLIQAEHLVKIYAEGSRELRILDSIDLAVGHGEFTAIMGPSGSGKSTLLHILGCMDRPNAGRYLFAGLDLTKARENHLARLRSCRIGFVFQSFNLIHNLNVLENVELPFLYAPRGKRKSRRNAEMAIDLVGLSHRMLHRPAQLSGGELQRAAIARALAVDPELILADEPTGNLDAKTGRDILELLAGMQSAGKTIIMVTHDPKVAGYAKKVMTLENGRLF